MYLLPQIPKFAADDLSAKMGRLTVGEAYRERALDHPLKVFSPTGGSHLTEQALSSLVTAIEQIARENGYPKNRPKDWSDFDGRTAARLHQMLRISANEAAKSEGWMFLGCVAMPDIVIWRQRRGDAAVNADNFLDTTNNLFRRLWWRATIFRDASRLAEPFWLLDELLEDAVQTFYERRSLSGLAGMGVAFGRVYVALAKFLPPGRNMEPLERNAQKWLVRVGENIAFDVLDEAELFELVAEAFHAALPPADAARITPSQIATLARPTPPPVPAAAPVVAASPVLPPPLPTAQALEFSEAHRKFFRAEAGTFSLVTQRESDASEVNLTGPEAKLAEQFFGRERIHAGAVRADPTAAAQRFRLHPTGDLIYLNLVYPKPDRTEMRLYLSAQKGFKPAGGAIWFLFQRGRDLFVGSMPTEEWNHQFNGTA